MKPEIQILKQGGSFPVGAQIAQGAIAQAYEDSKPVLGITAGPSLSELGQNWFDITKQYEGITKWTGFIPESRRIPEFMRRALTYLRTGRRGPVLLILSSCDLNQVSCF